MKKSPFNHEVLTQRLYFIGGILSYLFVLNEQGIDEDNNLEFELGSKIKQFESKGYSLAEGHFGNEIKTPSGWHFNIHGINNLMNTKLVLGDNFQ